ncbi:hypothetical protein [Psychromicrobium xiongbiense]|uniref:hypothetical protein n=1 Tax=Psychromicrobium xiongbiense TaxID=3051184 RepID=UPI0025530AD3|nr:hypothetical protein [Psychromicrobium sp. YIM S02556]
MSEPLRITADQASQPTLGALTIGIIAVGEPQGIPSARLLLRPRSGDEAVTLQLHQSLTVPGYGELTLEEVTLPENGQRGSVQLALQPHPGT